VNHLLSPVTHALAGVLAGAHSVAGALSLPEGSGLSWLAAIALLVLVVRSLMVPLVVRGVRDAHSRARARPQLLALRQRYAGRRDAASLERFRAEQREVHAEHRVSGWGLAPALLQLPLLLALYHVVQDVSSGHPLGALDAGLVASATSASLLGVHLSSRLGTMVSATPSAALALGLVAVLSAFLSYATQHWFTGPMSAYAGQSEPMAAVQRVLPVLSAVGVLVSACFVPAGLVVYWCLSNLWTFAQQAVVWRFAPTPGSLAALRRAGVPAA
jgi:YidC/Oxa1 family membrane protein insertase